MEKTWIDKEGRLRLEHDENYQMLLESEIESIWKLTDSWSIKLACALILTGYNLDIERTIEYGLEECPMGSWGNDRANVLLDITGRFMTIARSSIQAGKIKEHDSPENWIKWAKSKGYSVAHLLPVDSIAPTANGETAKGITKQAVINAFEGLHFDSTQWNRALGKSIPNWLKVCRVTPGKRGCHVSAMWNPVLIATALFGKGIQIKKLDSVFVNLKDFKEEWQEASAYFRD